MNVITRGVRNSFRNSIRTFGVVVIVGLSIGLSLAMLVARQAVSQKIESVKSSVGNTITVSPAGARGFEGGGEPLTTAELSKVASLNHVSHVTETLNDRLTSSDTSLVSAIDAGSLGRRGAARSGISQGGGDIQINPDGPASGSGRQLSFTPPVSVIGVSDLSNVSIYGGSTVTFTSGKPLDPTKDENVAVVGKGLAAKNNLSVGSTFTAYSGTTITVVGIYDTGNEFSNAGLVMSLPAVQRLSGQTGDITSATVTVDSLNNMDSTTKAITDTLGSTADVVSNADTAKNAVAPLENIKNVSLFSLIGSVAAAAVIILLTMIMIVRERRREIGVLKAIGASNLKVMFQFMAEAVTFTLMGAVVGLGIGVVGANPITKLLVNNSSSSSSPGGVQTVSGGPVRGGGGAFFRAIGGNGGVNIKNIHAAAGWSIVLYGFIAAIFIAIIGSAVSSLLVAKIRPAEVMRAE